MKIIRIAIIVVFAMFAFLQNAIAGQTYYVELIPVAATYEEAVEDGVTVFKLSEVPKKDTRMSFSGTSICQVVDLSRIDMDGYLTFQFKSLAGATNLPVSGTTISVAWKGSDVDNPQAWSAATRNTIVNGINALTGATSIVYSLNSISGVTPVRYVRFEYISGVSKDMGGNGNLRPTGILFVR